MHTRGEAALGPERLQATRGDTPESPIRTQFPASWRNVSTPRPARGPHARTPSPDKVPRRRPLSALTMRGSPRRSWRCGRVTSVTSAMASPTRVPECAEPNRKNIFSVPPREGRGLLLEAMASRRFDLPIERPGARYLTKIQKQRLQQSLSGAANAAAASGKSTGASSSLSGLIFGAPARALYRNRVVLLAVALTSSAVAVFLLARTVRALQKRLLSERAEVQGLSVLIMRRLRRLKERLPAYWAKRSAEVNDKLRGVERFRVRFAAAAVKMLFDDLERLSAVRERGTARDGPAS